MEGYDLESVHVEEIMEVPENMHIKTGWPDEEELTALGAKFIRNESPRVVEITGRKFCEGMMDSEMLELYDNIFEERGQSRPNKTQKTTIQ